jgi:hypothetical protein
MLTYLNISALTFHRVYTIDADIMNRNFNNLQAQ